MENKEEVSSDWVIESNVKLFNGFIVVLGSLGLVLIFLTRNRLGDSDSIVWGYWVGVLLISIAVGVFTFFEKTVIRVDRRNRKLLIQKRGPLTQRNFILPFEEIESVNVATIGRRHRGVVTHHLVLSLKSGKKEIPGRFSFDPSEIVEISKHLAEEIGCTSR